MTFKMFNWINERLKAQHELEFRMETSGKHLAAPLDRQVADINFDTDMDFLSVYIKQEIKRYRPGYYNFYLFDKTTEEKFMVHGEENS